MSILSIIFPHKASAQEAGWRVGGMEDFMMLIRVYFQASMASGYGISNLAMLPDLRVFKQTLKVATVNNRLGVGERSRCRKMLQEIYGLSDQFFTEIDQSLKQNCRSARDIQTYLIQFQGFSQDLMMLMGNLMKWKFRLPGFLKQALYNLTEKQVNEILTRSVWKDEGVQKAAGAIRQYQHRLGFSAKWMTEYVYNIVILAKKEPKKEE